MTATELVSNTFYRYERITMVGATTRRKTLSQQILFAFNNLILKGIPFFLRYIFFAPWDPIRDYRDEQRSVLGHIRSIHERV